MESILFVAPFKEIADIAREVLAEMSLPVPVIVADNERAVRAVREYPRASVIISRGGTANDLKVLKEKTIVEVNTTFTDILLVIEDALLAGHKQIGVVTRDNIIDNVTTDFDFLGTKIFIRPCRSDREIRATVQQLHSEGADFIIGCNRAMEAAAACGMDHAYIESGKSSIQKAINEAIKIVHSKEVALLQLERMNAVINNIQEGVVILTRDHQPVFYNKVAGRIFGEEQEEEWHERVAGQLTENGKEQIVAIGRNKVLLKNIPLRVYDKYKNDVWIFQEVSSIEKSERKIRLSMYNKGFYAKRNFEDIISRSAKMKEIIRQAKRFAHTNSNVLIYGETGTGKEGLAQSIHNGSRRAKQPFISVNCASLPPNLIESELFGYVDGAFTGARKSGKRGLFELAHEGTIFLDEIGEMPLDIQSRLLRVLQEREIMRIGDDKIVPLDIRVICATNQDLRQLAQAGKFRYDLYYRINVLRLKLPPLRKRREDILPLFAHYMKRYHEGDGGLPCLSPDAEKLLLDYSWPGNVRELKNVAEVLAFEGGSIRPGQVAEVLEEEDEADSDGNPGLLVPAGQNLKEMEREILRQLLARQTAEEVCAQLGISRVTLWRKMK